MMWHVGNNYHLTTFLFSLILAYLYAVSRSLLVCIIAHAVYNFIAYVEANYLEFHNVRTIDQLDSTIFWVPQMWMLGLSSIFVTAVIAKYHSKIRDAWVEPL